MHRSSIRRAAILSSAVAVVALGTASVRGQNIVVNDVFDDGVVGTNANGVGGGFVPIGINGATAPVETGGAFHVDTTTFGDYAAQSASSKTGFDFWNSGGATVQWTTGNVAVSVDQTGVLGQFPGAGTADWRYELGVVSSRRSSIDGISDELYANSQGGLYINLYYNLAGGSGPLTVTGALRTVNKNHPASSDGDSAAGIDTIATFSFSDYHGVDDLITSLTVNDTGFSLHFDHDVSFSISPLMGGSVIDVDSQTLVGNYSDFNKSIFSDEFSNPDGPDAFAWMQGQNLGPGRGSGDIKQVLVDAAQVAPPQDRFFDVSAGNWHTATNWAAGTIPASTNYAVVDNNGTVTIDQAGAAAVYLDVGSDRGLASATSDATGRGGTVNVVAGGELTVSDVIRIGQARNSTGAFNVSGGSVTVSPGASLSDIYIGDNGNGVMTMTDGTVTIGDELFLGLQPGSSGSLAISGGTLTTAGRNLLVGFGGVDTVNGLPGASGTLDISGTATINTHFLFSSFNPGSISTLTMTGGTLNCDGAVVLGSRGTSTFTHSGGAINVPTGNGDFVIADQAGAVAIYNISGTATVTTKNSFVVGAFAGPGAGANGTMNMAGGTITVGTDFFVGRDAGTDAAPATGVVNQSGGSITAHNIYISSRGVGAYTLSGSGSLTQSGAGNLYIGRDGGAGGVGTGTLTQTGGSVTVQNHVFLGDFDSSLGTYKISGGSLSVGGNFNVGAALASNAAPDDTRTGTGGQALDAKGSFVVSGHAASINIAGQFRANAGDKTRAGIPNQSNLGFEIFDSSGTSLINVAQNADLDGAVVDLKLMNGYVPAAGQTFDLMHAVAFGATGTGTTNDNGSTGTNMILSPASAGQFTLAVLTDGTGETLKASAGAMTVANLRLNRVAVPAGTLHVQANGADAGTSKVASLTIGATGALDLSDNDLVIDYASTSPLAAVKGYLTSGRASGNWAGTIGIISLAARNDASQITTIGLAEASDLFGVTESAAFSGQTVDATSLLLKYTYYGDFNLDGAVNADDYALIDRALAMDGLAGTARWIDGDADYSGTVDVNDYLLIDRAFALGHGGVLSPAFLADRESRFGEAYVTELVASVPEPAAFSVATLAVMGLLPRRRRWAVNGCFRRW